MGVVDGDFEIRRAFASDEEQAVGEGESQGTRDADSAGLSSAVTELQARTVPRTYSYVRGTGYTITTITKPPNKMVKKEK